MDGTYTTLGEGCRLLKRSRRDEIAKIESLRWRLMTRRENVMLAAYQRAWAEIKRLKTAYYVCDEGVRVYKYTKGGGWGDGSLSSELLDQEKGAHPLTQLAAVGREIDYMTDSPRLRAGIAYVQSEEMLMTYAKHLAKVNQALDWAIREQKLLGDSWMDRGPKIVEINGRLYRFQTHQARGHDLWPDPAIPIVRVT